MKATLCLNMIVKNEAANIERCLRSVKPWISCYLICDTGSTDNTVELIKKELDGVPGVVENIPFVTFGDTRNQALMMARKYLADNKLATHILFDDADMELVVSNPEVLSTIYPEKAYTLVQKSNGVVYSNVRIVSISFDTKYRGVTHEFVDTAGAAVERLDGMHYIDYATGSNRPNKFIRDIALLKDGIINAGDLVPRYAFYLAQSYKDAGKLEDAIRWYDNRAELGGWQEEVWHSKYMAAICSRRLGRDNDFVARMMEVTEVNPNRAEGWACLSGYYREKSFFRLAYYFANMAMRARPDANSLFLESDAYYGRPLFDLSIAGYYVDEPDAKVKGRDATILLMVDPNCTGEAKNTTKRNLRYYLETADKFFPGAEICMKGFGNAEGIYAEANPSITNHPDGGYIMNVRLVNYEWQGGEIMCIHPLDGGSKIITKNAHVRIDKDMKIVSRKKVSTELLPEPPHDSYITGYEDLRLFYWKGKLCASAMSARHDPNHLQQVLLEFDDEARITSVTVLKHSEAAHEKNWMPWVRGDELFFIYKMHPFLILKWNDTTKVLEQNQTADIPLSFQDWKGGSQVVQWGDGWIVATHESADYPDKRRVYSHRLTFLDKSFIPRMITDPFVFTKVGLEFCAGIARCDGGLLLSFGLSDRDAAICRIPDKSIENRWRPVVAPWRPF